MIAEYVEIETPKINQKIKAVKERQPHFVEIMRMLENWGIWARVYYDGAHPKVNMLYKLSKQATHIDIVDIEIELIDNLLIDYKNSNSDNEKDWYKIVCMKYKGVEIIDQGSQIYKTLKEFMIAKELNCSQKTVNNKFHKLIDDLTNKIYTNKLTSY